MTAQESSMSGEFQSPGGFVFGVAGWTWGEPRPVSITFFTDGTAKVSDQHGRPIRGTVVDGKEVRFAQTPPAADDPPDARKGLATHAQVVAALAAERVDWRKLASAGWPQLPAEELAKGQLPPTPIEELRKIRDPLLRKEALRVRRASDAEVAKELVAADEE